MTRRLAITIGAFSVIAAVAIATALIVRSPHPSRISTIGTIGTLAPSAPTTPTTVLAAHGPSLTSAPATFPTATTVPIPPSPTSIKIPGIGVDAPIVAVLPQQVLALAHEDVGLGLDPVAVDQKAALDQDLTRVGD